MIRGQTQPLRSNHPIWNGGSARDFDASRMPTAYPFPSYRPPQPTNTAHMGRSSSKNMKIHIYSAAGPNPLLQYMQLTNHTWPTYYFLHTNDVRSHMSGIKVGPSVTTMQRLQVKWLVLRGLQGPIGPKGTALKNIRTVHTYSWDSITTQQAKSEYRNEQLR